MPMRDIMVGESLVGDGDEVAHIDLMIGPKNGPVGEAFDGDVQQGDDQGGDPGGPDVRSRPGGCGEGSGG